MIIYHGGTTEIKRPKIIKHDQGRDFGFAFYTTDIQEQAERWAIRRAKLLSRVNNQKVEPVVSVYQYTEDDTLVVKKYAEANEDWLNMILK